jgi:hypothetical protein
MRALGTITYPMLGTHPDFTYVVATTLGHTDTDQASDAQLCLHAQVYTAWAEGACWDSSHRQCTMDEDVILTPSH